MIKELWTVCLDEIIVDFTLADKSADNGKVLRHCSHEYLVAITLEAFKAQAFPFASITRTLKIEEQRIRLESLIREVRRLKSNSKLFETEDLAHQFFILLSIDSRILCTTVCKDLVYKDTFRRANKLWKEFTKPSFHHGLKPWEQFLLNGSPASILKLPQTSPKSSTQIIPSAGMRVIHRMSAEIAGITRFFNEVSETIDIT